MLVALSSPSTPGLGGPVPHDAPGAHPAQGAAFAMVAYAGDRQPIYMPRFGFYVAPRPTNKQSILYSTKEAPAAFFAVRASCSVAIRYRDTSVHRGVPHVGNHSGFA